MSAEHKLISLSLTYIKIHYWLSNSWFTIVILIDSDYIEKNIVLDLYNFRLFLLL